MNRPIGVWLVTIYAALNALIGAVGVYILVSGKFAPVAGQQASFFANLNVLDYALSVLLHISMGLGGIFIFMLRKFALPLFIAGACFNLAQTIWHIFTHRFMAGVGGQSTMAWIELVVAWAIILGVIAYTSRLSKKGIIS
jgi:hypothetical protein